MVPATFITFRQQSRDFWDDEVDLIVQSRAAASRTALRRLTKRLCLGGGTEHRGTIFRLALTAARSFGASGYGVTLTRGQIK